MAVNPLPPNDLYSRDKPGGAAPHRTIGAIMSESGRLTERDIKRVVAFQKKKGLRFGEAARGLGLASDEDIQRALAQQFNYPYVRGGESGASPMLISAYRPFDTAAESFRMLRSQLALRWFDHGHKTLAIGGPRAGCGASTMAANLAVSFAQLGERTLLLDANFRRPSQHLLFGVAADIGLADVLVGRTTVEKAVVRLAQLNGLAVLCAGPTPPNPHELLSSRALHYLIDLAQEYFDVVIFDTPPILEYADAQMISARAGAYVMVARRHQTRLADLEAAKARLAPAGATLLGAVVNE
jgi:protein-tyrosine kinase